MSPPSSPQGHARLVLVGATLAGALTGLAVAPGGVGPLAWVALVPLLAVLRAATRRLAMVGAIVYATVGGLVGVSPWLSRATAAYFALSAWRAVAYILPSVAAVSAAHGALLGALLLARPRGLGAWAVLWYGATWACWEAVRTFVFPYYPAAVLGLSQWDALPILQIASACGIAGVTFVIVTANAGLAALVEHSTVNLGSRARAAATSVVLAIAALGWGYLRLSAAGTEGQPAGAAIVAVDIGAMQPAPSALDQYLAASSTRATARPALIIWPESALTTDIEHDRVAWAKLSGFVASTGTPLLAGGPGARRTSGRLARFNSAHLLQPGHGLQSYHKRSLVPFAERWPSILSSPPPDLVSLEPGRETPVFHVGDLSFGVLICFEIADSRGARTLARRGAGFIVNPTNDAWFYRSSAPHLPWAVSRAVETGLPVVRAANAGVSAVFDRFGRKVAAGPSAGLPSVLAVSLPAAAPTLYSRTGDWFLVVCLAWVVAGVGGVRVRRSPVRTAATAGGTPPRTHRGRSTPSPPH